jgi:hypothetical protein
MSYQYRTGIFVREVNNEKLPISKYKISHSCSIDPDPSTTATDRMESDA